MRRRWRSVVVEKPTSRLVRAQIEQEYGERLLKLSQIHLNEAEDSQSTIFETLGSLPVAMEAAARAHIDLAQQMHHLLETPLANFIKEQKTLRKKVHNFDVNGLDQRALFSKCKVWIRQWNPSIKSKICDICVSKMSRGYVYYIRTVALKYTLMRTNVYRHNKHTSASAKITSDYEGGNTATRN